MSNKLVNDLAAFREQALENAGGSGYTFQPVDGGEMFLVPSPLALTEDQNERLEKAKGNVAIAKALLNTEADPEVHARFIAAGGRSGDVLLAWRELTQSVNDPK